MITGDGSLRLSQLATQLRRHLTATARVRDSIGNEVRRLRQLDPPVPWALIADVLGVSRQAAQQTYGRNHGGGDQ